MEDLAVITALNNFGSFRKNFIKFKEKKIKMLFTSLSLSVLRKTVPSVLSTARWLVLETLGTDFPNTDLLAGK